MPDEARDFLEKGRNGGGAPRTAFAPDVAVGEGDAVELDDFGQRKDDVTGDVNVSHGDDGKSDGAASGLGESQVSVEVGVAESERLEADPRAKGTGNSIVRGSPDFPDDGAADVRQADGRPDEDRRRLREGVCCWYRAAHGAVLQCVEETPAMLSGLVLSLAFCVVIIILIPATGRVRHGK